MAQSQTTVMKVYHTVIEDVISGVRDSFLDEGVDEQVLQELKQIWESKLLTSKAVETAPEPEPQPPLIGQKVGNMINKPGLPGTVYSQQQQQQPQQQQQQQQVAPSQPPSQIPQQNTLPVDPNKQVPVQITLPAQAGVPDAQPRVLTIQVPASALQGNQLHAVLTGPVISATMALPQQLASTLLQQHVNAALQGQASEAARAQYQPVRQLDGADDTSDEDEDEDEDDEVDDDDEADDKEEEENEEEQDGGPEEEPLNSGDDVSDEDPTDLFDTDNVVVCQYDKITRSRNKWKFYLKDGIMNLSGKDYVFLKATGDAEW